VHVVLGQGLVEIYFTVPILYCTVLCCAVLYYDCTVLYCTVPYCKVVHSRSFDDEPVHVVLGQGLVELQQGRPLAEAQLVGPQDAARAAAAAAPIHNHLQKQQCRETSRGSVTSHKSQVGPHCDWQQGRPLAEAHLVGPQDAARAGELPPPHPQSPAETAVQRKEAGAQSQVTSHRSGRHCDCSRGFRPLAEAQLVGPQDAARAAAAAPHPQSPAHWVNRGEPGLSHKSQVTGRGAL